MLISRIGRDGLRERPPSRFVRRCLFKQQQFERRRPQQQQQGLLSASCDLAIAKIPNSMAAPAVAAGGNLLRLLEEDSHFVRSLESPLSTGTPIGVHDQATQRRNGKTGRGFCARVSPGRTRLSVFVSSRTCSSRSQYVSARASREKN